MNHTWSEDVTFFDKDEGVPQFQGQGNSSMLPQMMSTSSRDAALGAKNVDFQFEAQHPSSSSGQGAGAEGNLCKYPSGDTGYGAGAEGNLRKPQMENVMIDNSLSGAHPMYERPRVVEGPYAPVKTKKGQRGLDENLPEDPDYIRRAEYENLKDLRARLESTYCHMVAEVRREGRAVSEDADMRMRQAYQLL